LILSADFEDDDEEDDEDFEPNGEEEEDDDEEEISEGVMEGTRDRTIVDGLEDDSVTGETLENIQNAGLRSDLRRLREAFPKAPISVCENVLVGCDKDLGKAWETLSQAFKPYILRKAMNRSPQDQETLRPTNAQSKTKTSSKNKKLSILEHDKALDTNEDPPLGQDNSLLQYYDQHGLPEGSISTGKALSHMAKIVSSSNAGQSERPSVRNSRSRISTSTTKGNRSVRFAEVSSGTKTSDMLPQDESDDSDDEDFDLESSIMEPDMTSSSSSDGSNDDGKRKNVNNDESTSSEGNDTSSSDATSDSDSDLDSDSDAEPDEVSSRPTDLQENAAPEMNSIAKKPQKEQKTRQKGTVPPGQGKSSTRSRNKRRRLANLFHRYKEKGILPAGTTVKEFEKLELDRTRTPEGALQAVVEFQTGGSQKSMGLTEKAAANAAEFETRRQQLLNSLASGGVEVGPQSFSESLKPAPLDSVSGQAETFDMMAASVAAAHETTPGPSIDKVMDVVEASSAERDAKSTGPAMAITPAESPSQPPVMAAESTTSESALRPRRKIDLGAAGRLLFGALGVRAPKNKADNEKVRNDLMKDIRPSKAVTVEAATTEVESSNVDEDPETWREIINLRAVECCHDGVELSPAPFPFVQRWDPQQQGSYSKQGNRGGKGKRSQRNQSRYYDDEQQSSKKRKRNRNSYDSYYDSNEQYPAGDAAEFEDSNHYDEPIEMESTNAPNAQIVYSDGVEGAVNDQIMKDVQEAATSQVMDEDDLPRLPEDISILPNFTDDDVKAGMVIAFKQLILSEATNWQPQMSTYRTAVVIKASENGNLELRLAKRDREQTEKYYDIETGKRIYGKFDMPTDDGEEDDGFLEVTINELVEAKVVQLAPECLNALASSPELAHNKANTSADDSITLDHADSTKTSKASLEAPPEAVEETTSHQGLPAGDTDSPSIRGGDLSADDPDEISGLSISEHMREEISVLIKEAGFRTSIPSPVLRAQTQLPATPRGASEKGAYSPRFNGFDSSPSQPIQAISSPSHFDLTTPLTEDVHHAVSPSEDVLENKSTTSNVQYPKLSIPSSLASQVSDRGRQPDYPIPGEDALQQFDLDSFLGVPEELPLNRDENLLSGPAVNISDNSPSNHVRSSPSSSGDLPTLAEVFSTARSSIGPKHEMQPWLSQKTDAKDAKRIEESYNKEMEALDAMLEEEDDPEQITFKASQDDPKKQSTTTTTSPKESGSQFKVPPGSQQVDLTLSSDVELEAEKENVSDDSYDDDYGLPRGPGWVEKKTRRTRRQTTGSSQRVTKTRTNRRKTMTKF
jgi:hypothetical protein